MYLKQMEMPHNSLLQISLRGWLTKIGKEASETERPGYWAGRKNLAVEFKCWILLQQTEHRKGCRHVWKLKTQQLLSLLEQFQLEIILKQSQMDNQVLLRTWRSMAWSKISRMWINIAIWIKLLLVQMISMSILRKYIISRFPQSRKKFSTWGTILLRRFSIHQSQQTSKWSKKITSRNKMLTLMPNRIPQVTYKTKMQRETAKQATRVPMVRLLAVVCFSSLFKEGPAVCQFRNKKLQFKLNLNKQPRVPMWFQE